MPTPIPPADVVIIGAGSAGCVLARRLLDAGRRVTLVEAGDHDVNPDIDDVSRLGLLWESEVDWNYRTTPQKELEERRIHVPRGKVLGGSHALNATIWVRGDRWDFDTWATEHGCTGWSWDDVLPYFKAIESCTVGDDSTRGRSGLLDVTTDYPRHPIQEAMYDAAVEEGLTENRDYNSGDVEGVGWMQLNLRNGSRFNTWRAYLKPLANHENLTLITGATARRLLMEGATVEGAELDVDGEILSVEASEVVLCAGALGSPEIMLRSGIGPAGHLSEVGIDVAVDLPGVGRNLHDHLLVPVIGTTREPMPAPEVAAAQVHFFAKSDESLPVPDTQPLFFSVPMYTNTAGTPMEGPAEGFSLMAGIIRPTSRGSVTLTGPAPEDPIAVDLAALETEEDMRAMLFSLRQCRRIAAQPSLSALGAQEIHPGPSVGDDDEELIAYIRNTTTTYHHQVGTCAMGYHADSVVNPANLQVHGITGLRVADASIMPQVTTGNTNAPSVLIGERAAEMITGIRPF